MPIMCLLDYNVMKMCYFVWIMNGINKYEKWVRNALKKGLES